MKFVVAQETKILGTKMAKNLEIIEAITLDEAKEIYMTKFPKATNVYGYQKDEDTTTTNNEEETTMESTNITLDLTEGIAKFTKLDGTTYIYHIDTKRYAKTTADGKTKRIGKAEYEAAKREYDLEQTAKDSKGAQAELDKEPCRVAVENDLYKPAVIDEFGCVDCSECKVEVCVHRACMRRTPKAVGGLGECPRLNAKPEIKIDSIWDGECNIYSLTVNGTQIMNSYHMEEVQREAAKYGWTPDDEGTQDPELEQIEEEIPGIEDAEAELEKNIRKEKKTSKPRRSKDIAHESNGVTLTAKQVDFIRHISDTNFYEHGLESLVWCDVLADEIGGQFANKPMTVGAMISTLREKSLIYVATDRVNGKKVKYFGFTEAGKEIAKELGLE